ncbi:NUDIX domain-containing protein [Microbacterium sp. NPDC058345]|uniref:NUDIX domain-containing protein n=1 Tax=Microbacterium sp. NPDC058345 TaxID=3346455 RepID=UPI003649A50A
MKETRFKISAYGLIRREGQILLVRYVDPQTGRKWWTLPGGKLEHGEDPVDAVVREIHEETGYDASVKTLLGVGSRVNDVDWGIPGGAELHAVGVYYIVDIVGGTLVNEDDGSTDEARWLPEEDVVDLDRAVVVDIALDLERRRPADGRPVSVAVVDRLRH